MILSGANGAQWVSSPVTITLQLTNVGRWECPLPTPPSSHTTAYNLITTNTPPTRPHPASPPRCEGGVCTTSRSAMQRGAGKEAIAPLLGNAGSMLQGQAQGSDKTDPAGPLTPSCWIHRYVTCPAILIVNGRYVEPSTPDYVVADIMIPGRWSCNESLAARARRGCGVANSVTQGA